MNMRPLAALLAAAAFVSIAADTAQAQFNGSLLRTQARIVERSVARNLDRVFKPRLVVSKGATGPVSALSLSADERLLLTATGNHTVRVWDLWAGREVARLVGHRARITAIAIAKDGAQAVSVGEDKLIKVWNLKQLGEVTTLPEQTEPVTGVAISDDGTRLFTASADGKVRLWSLPAARLEREWAAHGTGFTRLALSADGKRLVSGGADGKVRLWDAASATRQAELEAGDHVLALAVAANGALAAGTADGDIRLWDGTGTSAARFTTGGRVTSVAFLPDGRVVGGGSDGAVKLWSMGSKEAQVLGTHDAGVSFVAANRDGGMALSGSEDGTSRLWNLRNNQPLLTLISTESGWAVVDAKGRYDGNQAALDGIDWKAEDISANIDDFAETHYQAALLPRTLREGEGIPDATSIPDGARYPANIRFASPTASGDGDARRVVVEVVAEDNGGGVSEVRLYRNGKVVPRGIGTVNREEVDGKAQLVGRFEVDLQAGRNTLSATAINAERLESRPEQLVVDGGTAAAPAGKMHVLAVGINAYAQSDLNLSYAKPDAQSVAEFLNGGGRAPMPVAETVTLEDEQATKDNILAALRRFRTVPAQDVVVVYLAGHGVSVGDDWYFISHEIKIPRRPEKLAGLALSSADLKAEMEALGADRTMLLLDTCHSGTAATPLADYRGMKSLRLLARSVGTHVLAATDKNQFAVELETLGHGIFTYTLLAGMKGEASRAGDHQVKASELIRFVEDQVPTLSRKFTDYAQYPTGYSRGTDFAVAVGGK